MGIQGRQRVVHGLVLLGVAACVSRVTVPDPRAELTAPAASGPARRAALKAALVGERLAVTMARVTLAPDADSLSAEAFNKLADKLNTARDPLERGLRDTRDSRLEWGPADAPLAIHLAGTVTCGAMVLSCSMRATLQLRAADTGAVVWDGPVTSEGGISSALVLLPWTMRLDKTWQALLEDTTVRATASLAAAREAALAAARSAPEAPVTASAPPGPPAARGEAVAQAGMRRIAVLEFRADKDVPGAVLAKLSDSARAGVLASVKTRGDMVMTRESMLAMIKDMGRCEATEGECEVETGRNIGADVVVTGDVLKVESTWVVTLKAFASGTGALLATAEARSPSQLDLFTAVQAQATTLLR